MLALNFVEVVRRVERVAGLAVAGHLNGCGSNLRWRVIARTCRTLDSACRAAALCLGLLAVHLGAGAALPHLIHLRLTAFLCVVFVVMHLMAGRALIQLLDGHNSSLALTPGA